MEAMNSIIVPALDDFSPQLIIVSCGFDAGAYDPLGRMLLHSDSFRDMTRALMDVASEHCEGKLIMCHEGGYEPNTVPYMGLAVLETLSGRRTTVNDPNLLDMKGLYGQAIEPYQSAHLNHLKNTLLCDEAQA
ncbi:Histone deacetylase/AcuC/AphA family protein (fragment) [Pseudomonas sp. JV551A1]|uniref:Histone deacetylase/AcuC/AphA family protein n=1 Tax=Pseudomonas inefficax TaxID=2078786 RepID=A0AAQ1SUI9_9PSED